MPNIFKYFIFKWYRQYRKYRRIGYIAYLFNVNNYKKLITIKSTKGDIYLGGTSGTSGTVFYSIFFIISAITIIFGGHYD